MRSSFCVADQTFCFRFHMWVSCTQEWCNRCAHQSCISDRGACVSVLPWRLRAGGWRVWDHVQSQSALVSISSRGSMYSRCSSVYSQSQTITDLSSQRHVVLLLCQSTWDRDKLVCTDLSVISEPATSTPLSALKCKLWETKGKKECVCLMPFQCP